MKRKTYSLIFAFAFFSFSQIYLTSAQSVGTTSSYSCAGGSQVTFFVQGGSSCSSPQVTSQSNWSVSPSTGVSITYVQTSTSPIAYNQIKVTFANADTYTIGAYYYCPATGSSGNATTKSFTVYPSSTPSVSLSSDKTTICGGGLESVTFTASPTNGGTSPSYTWMINGSSVSGQSGSTFTTSSLNNGDAVSVTMWSNKECVSPSSDTSDPITMSVTAPSPVSVTIQQVTDPPICSESAIAFSATGENWALSGELPASYQWYVNNNPVNPPDNPSNVSTLYNFIDNNWTWPDDASVELRVTSSIGCASPKPKGSNILTVDLQEKANFTGGLAALPSRQSRAYCENEIYFQATASHSVSTYYWEKRPSGGTFSSVGSNSATYDPVFISQGDEVKVTMTTNPNSCLNNTSASYSLVEGSTSSFIIKSPVSVTPVSCATEDADVCNKGRRCQGSDATTDFNATASNEDENGFIWTIEDAGSSSINSATGEVSWAPDFTGTATIIFKANGCGGPVYSSKQIIVDPYGGDVTVSIQQVTNPPICSGSAIAFSASGDNWGDGPPTFEWYIDGDLTAPPDNASGQDGRYFIDKSWEWPDNANVELRVTSTKTCASPKPKGSNILTVDLQEKSNFTGGLAALPSRQSRAYCENEIYFQATASHSVSAYYWEKRPSGGTFSSVGSNSATYDPVFISQGDEVKVTMTANPNSCLNNTSASYSLVEGSTSSFIIKSPVSVTAISCATDDASVCTGHRCQGDDATTDFEATASNYDDFTWTIADAGSSSINSATGEVSWAPDFTGTATITFKANGCGGPVYSSKQITVDPSYTPPTLAIEGSTFVCPGSQVYFQTTANGVTNGGPNPSYQWWVNGNMVNNTNPDIPKYRLDIADWQHGDNAEVKLVMNTNLSCQVPNTDTSNIIMVRSTLNGVTITPQSGEAERCQGTGTTQFTASPIITTYNWQLLGGGTFSNITQNGLVNWDPDFNGTPYVSIFAEGCFNASMSYPYTVNAAPSAPENQSVSASNWEYVTLDSKSTSGYANWYNSTNTLVHSGATFEAGYFYNPGTYSYYSEPVSFEGCKSLTKSTIQLTINDQDNNKLNWIESKAFNLDGSVISNSRQYFDYSGNALQSQSKSFVHPDKIFISQGIKDRFDRNVGSTMAAPSQQTSFNYKVKFAWSESDKPYDHKDFDDPSSNTVLIPNPIDADIPGTLGWYYSSNNIWEQNVPTTNYPYSRTEFYDDGTGEARRSAGPGDMHRLGQGHEVLSGTFPVFGELNDYLAKRTIAIPGITQDGSLMNEAVQSVGRDQNGKFGISISDKSGQSVMSCRAGTASDNVLTITNTITSSGDPNDAENYRPMTYFYILHDQPVTITGSTDFVVENIVSNVRKDPGVTFADEENDNKWPAGFYRILLSNISSEVVLTYTNYFLDVSYQFYNDAGRLVSSISPNGFEQWKSVYKNDFKSNYSPFESNGTITPSIDNGRFKIAGASRYNNVAMDLTTVNGHQYTVRFTIDLNSSGEITAFTHDRASGLNTFQTSILSDGGHTYQFTATSTSTLIIFENNVDGPRDFYLDDIVIEDQQVYDNIDKTTYQYNHQGWLLSITEPDAGKTQYVYRKDGKIRFSQNALQLNKNRFSYTHYDQLGRPIESGEYTGNNLTFTPHGSPAFAASEMKDQLEKTLSQLLKEEEDGLQVPAIWGIANDMKDWVRTHYDNSDPAMPALASEYVVDFVRGAVAWTENANIKTWYSYDEFGRVTWMAQKPVALNRVFATKYTYDFLGNVLQVLNTSYAGIASLNPFYHHYEYDADQRLSKVFTSMDGSAKKLRATYEYYLHGPLKRIELGENVQGIDFIYNIHGWLTQINHPDKNLDPGGDTNDAFGMVLDYYESDLNGLFQTGLLNPHEKLHRLPFGSTESLAAQQPLMKIIDQGEETTLFKEFSAANGRYKEMINQLKQNSNK